MKKLLLLLSLSASLPLVGMEKLSACMLYCKPTKQDAYAAVFQSGLITAQMASCHPKVKKVVEEKILPISFVAPALVVWKAPAITNMIMNQMPELNCVASYCMSTGIKDSLIYGGSALTAYLFYTYTWDGLTKGKLESIFKPQIEQGKRVKSLALINKKDAQDIKNKVIEFGKQIEQNKQSQLELEEATALDHAKLSLMTEKLKKSDESYKSLLQQLDALIKEINVTELNNKIKLIEQNQNAHNEKSQMRLQDASCQIDSYHTKMVDLLNVHNNELSQRFTALTILSHSLDEDINGLINQVAFLAKSLDESRSRTRKAVESVNRLSKAVAESAALADDGSESESAASDSEAESEVEVVFIPRSIGGSKAKPRGK